MTVDRVVRLAAAGIREAMLGQMLAEVERGIVDPPGAVHAPSHLVQHSPQLGQQGEPVLDVGAQRRESEITGEREHKGDIAGRVGRIHRQVSSVDWGDVHWLHGGSFGVIAERRVGIDDDCSGVT